jgi:hypothetical protein
MSDVSIQMHIVSVLRRPSAKQLPHELIDFL